MEYFFEPKIEHSRLLARLRVARLLRRTRVNQNTIIGGVFCSNWVPHGNSATLESGPNFLSNCDQMEGFILIVIFYLFFILFCVS